MVYGSAGRAYRLLRCVAPEDYCIITRRDMESGAGNVAGVRLPCAYHMLPSEWRRFRVPSAKRLQPLVAWLNVWLKVLQRCRNVIRCLKAEKCGVVVSFTGALADIPAAYLAARFTGCRFFPIVDDDYLTQWTEAHELRFVRQVAPFVFGRADGLFVISEYLAEDYRRRYRRNCTVLHTATLDRVGDAPGDVPMAVDRELRLVFSGTVYIFNRDAVAAVARALDLLSDSRARLHIYGWQTAEQLAQRGVKGFVEVHGSLDPDAVCKVQEEADILLVTFGFRSEFKDICRTSFPSKIADYLVSGRPILAVTPPESYLAWYLRTHQCGHVVDRDDADLIAEGIRRLVADREYRTRLVGNAFAAARRDCSYDRVVQVFSDTIGKSV